LAANDPKSLTDILLLVPENERQEALNIKGGWIGQTAYDIAFRNTKTMEVILRLCKENAPGPSSINSP